MAVRPPTSQPAHRLKVNVAHAGVPRTGSQKPAGLPVVGRSRIHLDRVKGLGDFLELEVVLRDGESTESGVAEASVLMARLGIPQESLIDGAYVDLLSEKRTTC